MKLLFGLLWASASLRLSAAATEASIYIQGHDADLSSNQAPSISPSTARLLLAQQLGLSQYHNLGVADQKTLDILNTYGGGVQAMFGDLESGRQQSSDRLLLIAEGVEYPEDVMESHERPSILMQDPPSAAQNGQLAKDLLEQALHTGSGKTMSHIKHNLSLQGLSRKDGIKYNHAISTLKTILKTHQHQHPASRNTIILMPPASMSKRSIETSAYGTYDMPLKLRHPQHQQEEPLEFSSTQTNTPSPDVSTLQSSKNKTLPHGILKICHPTLDSANKETNNCSSHGKVYLLSSGVIDCYACRCSTTSNTDAEGKTKTVYWSGPACQKKDVSFQFWLLAGMTILLVAIVGWGIGLLVSIGSEDLPSVIGAGVTGPRAQK